jgi:adenylate cyclase
MRLLPNVRVGTERYPEKVARQMRTLNIGSWVAAAMHAFYAAVLCIDLARFWWLAVVNVVAVPAYAGVPLLHRLGRLAAPVALTTVFYADMFVFVCLIGTGAGIQFYFLVGATLTVLYLDLGHAALAAVFAAVAAALIAGVQLWVPHDTGLLPPWLMVTSIATNAVVSCGTLLLIVGYATRQVARAETAAEREYERSERLLANILPASIAARLKHENAEVIADRHDEASILFADMAGLTAQASDMAPEDLVQFLNRVFSDFDRLVERHGLEKIKTTGDAYMVVSGVPTPRPDHAEALAALALEMRDAAAGWRDPRGRAVPIRMGISSGLVVAGVVGTRKFFYDVWGDAVNVAARMETTGEPGRIQVSQDSCARLRDGFVLEPRGEIEVKGKGLMPTWFLLARKTPDVAAPVPSGTAAKV